VVYSPSMSIVPFAVNLDMSDEEASRSERHAFVNLVNVVHSELQLIERMLSARGALRGAVRLCETAAEAFRDRRVAHREARDLELFRKLIEQDIENAIADVPDAAITADVNQARSIIDDVIAETDLRVQEVLTIHGVVRPAELREFDSLARAIRSTAELARLEIAPAGTNWSEIHAPYRFGETLGSLLGRLEKAQEWSEIISVELEPTESGLRVTIDGISSWDALMVLTSGLRPRAILRDADSNQVLVRHALLLWYLTQPGGSIALVQDKNKAQRCAITLGNPGTDS
jgi:hypothetical protein